MGKTVGIRRPVRSKGIHLSVLSEVIRRLLKLFR